jgi:hypothetical protein
MIIPVATGSKVLPGGLCTTRSKDDVVERQVAAVKLHSAILASAPVAQKDVALRGNLQTHEHVLINQQLDNTGKIYAGIDRHFAAQA